MCKQCGMGCKSKIRSPKGVVSRIEELRPVSAAEVEPVDLIPAQEEDSDVATVGNGSKEEHGLIRKIYKIEVSM